MYPAVNAQAFRDAASVGEQLARAAALGFEGLELTLTLSGPLTPSTPPAVFAEAAAQAADRGLRLAGLGSGLFMETHYASPEPVARARARELTLRMLDDAAAGGVEAIMVIPAVVGRATEPRPRVGYEDAYQRTFEALCELRLEAEARAVTIGLENAWNRFLLSPLEVAGLLDEIGSPHVGWHLDVGNILPYGYPEDWIAVLGRRIVRVHAKDYDLSKVGPAGFCALGEGSVNWPAVLAALRAAGYAGPLTYEGDVSGTDVSRRLRALLAGDFAVGQEGPA